MIKKVSSRVFWATTFLAMGSLSAAAQSVPPPEKITIDLPRSTEKIELIRLPRTKDILPIVSSQQDTSKHFATRATYMASVEMTLSTVKSLLSEESWDRYQQRVLGLTGTDDDPKWSEYRDAVRAASSELPAAYLGIHEIVEICQTLDAEAKVDGTTTMARMEKLQFRIPARAEWQFAARCITSTAQRKEKLHFPSWPKYGDVPTLEGKISDLQQQLGVPVDPLSEDNWSKLARNLDGMKLQESGSNHSAEESEEAKTALAGILGGFKLENDAKSEEEPAQQHATPSKAEKLKVDYFAIASELASIDMKIANETP